MLLAKLLIYNIKPVSQGFILYQKLHAVCLNNKIRVLGYLICITGAFLQVKPFQRGKQRAWRAASFQDLLHSCIYLGKLSL